MRPLSAAGRRAIEDIAARHGFSPDATLSMLQALVDGNGTMAQFDHPEFAGAGQWMRGGMTMVSDLFNDRLKGRVDGLCRELSDLLAAEPGLVHGGSFQSQRQGAGPGAAELHATPPGGGQHQHQAQQRQAQGERGFGAASLFVPPPAGSSAHWWPADLQGPTSTGAQNDVRYAYFASQRRLAIDLGGTVTVYDTLDHRIGGFSQQQSVGGSLSFTSQHGLVDVASLPVVSGAGAKAAAPARSAGHARGTGGTAFAPPGTSGAFAAPGASAASGASGTFAASGTSGAPPRETARPAAPEHDVLATIERLAELKTKGILTDEEFAAKKAELLKRL